MPKEMIAVNSSYPVVCIGASAGGLEALIEFFKFLPKNIPMAFVLIQHLEPQHESALPEILSRETSLTIRQAKNNEKVKRAHVYVIPPNTFIAIFRGRLKITSRRKRVDGTFLPIDFFMASLAKDQGKMAIGIILSGTGTDGTLGAKAIKDNGGIIFAQDQNSARYFGMPGSAAASHSVDFVLEPGQIARKLVQIGMHGNRRPLSLTDKSFSAENDFNRLLGLLQDSTGVDFTHYKKPTISRRITRRMSLHNIKKYAEYYDYIKKNPSEINLLHKDILIPVTSFFRDPEIFAALRKNVFPSIINNRSEGDPVRLWVPACSTGEEVYSIVISVYEFFEEVKIKPNIQAFGTDLSEQLIEKARAGLYPEGISEHVSAQRLKRFFTKAENGYKIAKHIRELCVFAKQDITSDPPLSNMDMISCRNLLIYLDVFLQKKALSMMHYALKPKGFLLIGTSESVYATPNFFTFVDKKHKIYSKNIVTRRTMLGIKKISAAGIAPSAEGRAVAEKIHAAAQTDKARLLSYPKKIQARKSNMPKETVSGKKDLLNAKQDVAKLKKKFALTVRRMEVLSEEKDAFNEELRAANEEIQSSNEELQSMNEELETSKEELQSTNEELLTLNDELRDKNLELNQLNSDLTNVFFSTNIPMIIVGNDLRIRRFTPTARKVMNLISTDVDRPIGDIKLNINIANLEEIILKVIEEMIPTESEIQDKEGRWYSMRIRPYRTIDNKIDGAVIALIDIDVIKRIQDELKFALDYTQAIIETMREPLLVLDKDARVISANKSFYNMFKVTVSEVENKLVYDLGGQAFDKAPLRKMLEDILPKKTYFDNYEVSFDFPKIGLKTMILNGRQIKLFGEDKNMILLVIEDITKRKLAERVLARDNETLEKMVNKRSRELLSLQAKLESSKRLSDVGTLAASVAHEIRNPLTAISMAAANINRKIKRGGSIDQHVRVIENKISQSNRIINNLLFYSRIQQPNFENVSICNILKECFDTARKQYKKKVSLRIECAAVKDVLVKCDPAQLIEVFQNIANNSFDSISADQGKIQVKAEDAGEFIKIIISDNGSGINKDDLKKAFNPFFTTKAKGTGLGLTVCKQILDLNHGTISIESKQGEGTTVSISLPKE